MSENVQNVTTLPKPRRFSGRTKLIAAGVLLTAVAAGIAKSRLQKSETEETVNTDVSA